MADVPSPIPGSTDMVTDLVQVVTPPVSVPRPRPKANASRSPVRFSLRKSSGSSSSSDSTGVSPTKGQRSSMFDLPKLRGHRPQTVPGVAQKGIVSGAEAGAQGGAGSNRGNLIALALVLSYIAVGILYFHFVEGWGVVDCIYYAMVIVTTVGYGDVFPVKTAGKAFTIFFAFYGICTIGIALGRLAAWFLGRQKQLAKQTTQRLLHSVDNAVDQQGIGGSGPDGGKEVAVAIKDSSTAVHKKRRPKWKRVLFSDSNKAIASALVPIALSIIGGLVVGWIEGWPPLDCFYYSIITITTVGFGDLSPKSEAARIYAIFFLPLSVVSVAHGIGSIMEEIGKRRVMKSKISMKELLAMDSDGDGKVSQMEYLCYMLVKLGKAEADDIEGILAQFRKLDKDGSGELDKEDLERLDRQLQRQHEAQDD